MLMSASTKPQKRHLLHPVWLGPSVWSGKGITMQSPHDRIILMNWARFYFISCLLKCKQTNDFEICFDKIGKPLLYPQKTTTLKRNSSSSYTKSLSCLTFITPTRPLGIGGAELQVAWEPQLLLRCWYIGVLLPGPQQCNSRLTQGARDQNITDIWM